jgi:hypothetical protein
VVGVGDCSNASVGVGVEAGRRVVGSMAAGDSSAAAAARVAWASGAGRRVRVARQLQHLWHSCHRCRTATGAHCWRRTHVPRGHHSLGGARAVLRWRTHAAAAPRR